MNWSCRVTKRNMWLVRK